MGIVRPAPHPHGSSRDSVREPERSLALCRLCHVEAARQADLDPVLCPVLDYVDAADAALIAALPLFDANDLLMKELERLNRLPHARRPTAAAFFAADPFLHVGSLVAQLRKARIRTVVNFPTVQIFDGMFGENLDRMGCGVTLELERLAALREEGFDACGLMLSDQMLPRILRAGLDRHVLLSPDRPAPDASAGASTLRTIFVLP